jgi:hypothetical protein
MNTQHNGYHGPNSHYERPPVDDVVAPPKQQRRCYYVKPGIVGGVFALAWSAVFLVLVLSQ